MLKGRRVQSAMTALRPFVIVWLFSQYFNAHIFMRSTCFLYQTERK